MTGRWIVEYVVNCAWQIPLLAAGAWMLVKVMRPGVLAQHWLWLSVLALSVVLPGCGIDTNHAVRSVTNASTHSEVPDLLYAPRFTPGQVGESLPVKAQQEVEEDMVVPVRSRGVKIGVAATCWLVRIYFAVVLFGAARFLRAWMEARRLVRQSRETTLGAAAMLVLQDFSRRLGVKQPLLRESDGIGGPVVVGMVKTILLVPEGFAQHAEVEIGAALCHELAHVRRRDYLVNLVCQVVALPVAWHPAVYAVQQRIRRTREMVCDAITAEEMQSGAGYARCLVSLAQQMVGVSAAKESQAMGLFENHMIEERVMKLTETKTVVSGRVRVARILCGGAAMVVMTGVAATFHVNPTFAAAASVQSTPSPAPSPAPAPSTAPQAKPSAVVVGDDAPVVVADGDHAKVIAKKGEYEHRWKATNGESFTIVNHDAAEPNTEEKLKLEQEAADSKKAASEAVRWVNGPEFKEKMAEVQKTVNSAAMKAQMEAANRIANDPEIRLRMEEIQKDMANLDLHVDVMPDLKKFNDPEWQKQFAELKMTPPDFKFKFDFDKQMAIANSIDAVKLNETIAESMNNSQEQMAKMQKEIESGELQRKLDEARRLLDEAQKQMDAMRAK